MEELKQQLLKNIDIIAKQLNQGNEINIKTCKNGIKISKIEMIK